MTDDGLGLGARHDVGRDPRTPLGVVLVLMRALAGRRGRSVVVWNGGGFRYALTVSRTRVPTRSISTVEADPSAPELRALRAALRRALLDGD